MGIIPTPMLDLFIKGRQDEPASKPSPTPPKVAASDRGPEIMADPEFQKLNPDTQRAILMDQSPMFRSQNRATQDAILKIPTIKATPSFWDEAKQTALEDLPLVGAIGGGLLGAPGGLGGSLVGAAAGYEGVRRLRDFLRGVPTGTLGEEYGKFKEGLTTGALTELGGQATGAAIGRVGQALHDVDAAAIAAAAREHGITLSPSVEAGSKMGAVLESVPKRVPIALPSVSTRPVEQTRATSEAAVRRLGGRGPSITETGQGVQDAAAEAIARAQRVGTVQGQQAVERLASIGSPTPGTSNLLLGGKVKEAVWSAKQAANETYQGLEQEFSRLAGNPMTSVEPVNDTARAVLFANEQALRARSGGPIGTASRMAQATEPPPIRPGDLQEDVIRQLIASGGLSFEATEIPAAVVRAFGLASAREVPLNSLLEARKTLREYRMRHTGDSSYGVYRQLEDAVTRAIEGSPGLRQPGAREALTAMRDFYRTQVGETGLAAGGDLMRLAEQDPGQIASAVLKAKPDDLVKLSRTMPQDIMDGIRSGVVDLWRQKAGDDPARLARQIRDFGEERLGLLFGAQGGEIRTIATDLERSTIPTVAVPALRTAASGRAETAALQLTEGIRDPGNVQQVLAAMPPDQRADLGRSLIRHMVDQARSPQTEEFSTQRMMTQLNRVPDAIWRTVLSPDDYAKKKSLEKVLARINTFDAVTANPSQTSHALLAFEQARQLITALMTTAGAVFGGSAGALEAGLTGFLGTTSIPTITGYAGRTWGNMLNRTQYGPGLPQAIGTTGSRLGIERMLRPEDTTRR